MSDWNSSFCQKTNCYKCWANQLDATGRRLTRLYDTQFDRTEEAMYGCIVCRSRTDEERLRKAEARKRGKAEMRQKKAAEEKRLARERAAADEACLRIFYLPEELKIYVLHFLNVRLIKKLKLPAPLLRAVLQAEELKGTQELIKFTWIHRLHSNRDRFALSKLAQEANLLPDCPVVKPPFMMHICNALCSWFAPDGGWDAVFALVPKRFAGYKCTFRVDSNGEEDFSFDSDSAISYDMGWGSLDRSDLNALDSDMNDDL